MINKHQQRMKAFNAFAALVLACNLAAAQAPITAYDTPVEATEMAVATKFVDLFYVAGFGYDYKLVPGTITFTARPEFFNPKYIGLTDPAEWKIERRWYVKAILSNGQTVSHTIKTWDEVVSYDYPSGTNLLWVGYEITPHHTLGIHSSTDGHGCSQGFWLQGFGGGLQPINPIANFYK